MVGTRKRKHAVSNDNHADGQQTRLQSIHGFGSVAKPTSDADAMKRRKTGPAREQTPPACAAHGNATSAATDKKRKRKPASASDDDSDAEITVSRRAIDDRVVSTPRNKRVKNALPLSPTQTPSKSTADLFDRLRLHRHAPAVPFVPGKQQQDAYETPPRTPEGDGQRLGLTLPDELQDLIQIHAVFLTALSLHFAQNGVSAGVRVAELLPNMTKAWKKRAVCLDDLHRALSVDVERSEGFVLEDCGGAGIRVVRGQARGRALKRASSFLDHDDRNASFEDALQVRWMKWQASVREPQRTASAFLSSLPLADIVMNTSATKAVPFTARGQQHLAAIKAAQTASQQAQAAASASNALTAAQKTTPAVQARSTTLLDRILSKQALAASTPAGPTRDQLDRRAALHRLEDIARVLDVLLGPKPRASFSMPVMVQNLQQSLRHPISREDVERTLGLLASEIAPGFVNVVQSGNVKAVVLCKARKIALEEVRQRVARACAADDATSATSATAAAVGL